jgi:dihydrofolate reductase
MRKVIFGGANSLDNFIARPDGGVDWILWSDEAAEVMKAVWDTLDTVVWGRKSYDFALEQGMAGAYPGRKNYVCSRTMQESPPGMELACDVVALVRQLKAQVGRDILIMSGGDLAASLLEAGLIDEIGLNIHPLLLGTGIPLFPGLRCQVDLELLEARPFKNGCVLVRYRVKR